MDNSNLAIVKRLLELGKNQPGYNEKRPSFPRPYKEEQIWLSNILTDSLQNEEREFKEKFANIVNEYKRTLREKKTYGWFHGADSLEWSMVHINQLKYAIYGDVFERPLEFKQSLGNEAYKDFIEQIDRTVLMTPAQLKKHNQEINRISNDILKEILEEKKTKK